MYLKYVTAFFLLQIIVSVAEEKELHREKRFYIAPPKAVYRQQVIWGVGVPLDSDYSVTFGWVLKSQFLKVIKVVDDLKPAFFVYDRQFRNQRSYDENETINIDQNNSFINDEHYNDDDDDDSNYYDLTQESPDWKEEIYQHDRAQNSRWEIYKMIEVFTDEKGFNGRECILKSICEAAEATFTHKSGIIGEILHILLTPSSTIEPLSVPNDEEYLRAEQFGKFGKSCSEIYTKCFTSVLDIFSDVVRDEF